MDFLTGVESQFAIPVVAVIVLAILVYLFGFQQTQEPSLQHLAVLHSGGKSNKSSNTANKPKNQSQNSSAGQKGTTSKGREKPISNGHAVHAKEKNKSEKTIASNKENVRPQQKLPDNPTPKSKKEKKVESKADEIDAGGWIPAVSRKDKKLRTRKEDISIEPVVIKSKNSNTKKGSSQNVLKEKEVFISAALEDDKPISSTPICKDKKKSPPAVKPAADVIEQKQTEKLSEVISTMESKTGDSVNEVEKDAELKEAEIVACNPVEYRTSVKSTSTTPDDSKNNIAFDEMGELWEEAKSRGAKKKRARKE